MPAGAYPDAGDGHRDYQPSRFADRRRLGSTPGVVLGHADGYPSQLAHLRDAAIDYLRRDGFPRGP